MSKKELVLTELYQALGGIILCGGRHKGVISKRLKAKILAVCHKIDILYVDVVIRLNAEK